MRTAVTASVASFETVEDWARLIRAEYNEMPGLCLTVAQASRLWGLPPERCREVLDALVAVRFLRVSCGGRFCRADGGSGPH